MTGTRIERIEDDPQVQQAQQACAHTQRALEDARAARRRLPPATAGQVVLDLEVLEADAKIRRIDAAHDEAVSRLRSVEGPARERVIAARRPGRLALVRRVLAAAEAAQAAAVALREYEEKTAAAVGLAPGPAVAPQLLQLADTLVEIRRVLDGPREIPRPAPGRGMVRVNVVQPFYDEERVKRYPGVEDVSEADAREAIEKAWAVAL